MTDSQPREGLHHPKGMVQSSNQTRQHIPLHPKDHQKIQSRQRKEQQGKKEDKPR